ncbi:MAG: hypothetical protein WD469_13975 [Paenibacillaceae bacterium]
MKKIDWFIASTFIAMGLICLSISATSFLQKNTFMTYFHSMSRICLWVGVPFFLIVVIYLLRRK